MLFDIFNYNITTAVTTYTLTCALLILSFRNSLTSLADPLFYHILWISSQVSFFIIYGEKYSVSLVYVNFAITLSTYVITLWFFCAIYRKKAFREKTITSLHLQSLATLIQGRWSIIATTLIMLYLYSNKSFLEYALTCTSPQELFLYRFIDLQGRNPIERILKISTYFLYFFLFTSILASKNRKISIAIIIIILAIAIASGGRSAIISFIISLGAFVFLHRFELTSRTTRTLNITIGALYVSAIFLAAIVSSFYLEGDSVASGFLIIFNRVFAAPDGIEYYLKFNGENKIDSGIGSYLTSIFGIYIQSLAGIQYKNIGWQLTELAIGDVDFAQGSNYTILLQAMVLSQHLAPLYGIAAGWFVARMRYITPRKPRGFFFVYTTAILCFTFTLDIEYFTLLLLSASVVYLLIIVPILRVKTR